MNTTTCPTHSWCKRTGDHADQGHSSHDTVARTATTDAPYLAGFLYAGDSAPVVAVHLDTWHDLTPTQLRVETARIRIQCDRLDSLATMLDSAAETPDTGALDAFLAAHHITQVPAGGMVAEPTFVSARGRRFLSVPTGTSPADVLDFVHAAFTTKARPADTCPAYSWCAELGEHDDHTSTPVAIDAEQPEDLDAVIMRIWEAQRPSIVIGNADLTPGQARSFAQWLLAAADQVDAATSTEQVTA